MKSLKDKFLLIDRGDNFVTGQVADVNGDYVLILMQTKLDCPKFYHVYHISELTCDCRECVNSYFFDNRDELEKWVAWIDPADDNIIPINGKKK